MPTFDYICEHCGNAGREWRQEKAPRFCCRDCQTLGMAGQPRPSRRRWIITPEAHEEIKLVYKTMTGNGEVLELSKRLGLPRWKITKHAIAEGWIAKQKKEPDWNEREIDILTRNAHFAPNVIQNRLSKYGYRRSETAIVLKRKRLRLRQNLDGESANMLAQCLGVDIHVVLNAIKGGRLKATGRQTKRTTQQRGDIWFIRNPHIKEYLLEHIGEIDIRKVDKYWFVDMLTS